MRNIGIIVGSLRRGSFSKSIASFVEKQSTDDFAYKIINISELPIYNQDYDEDSPKTYLTFRGEIKDVDAVLLITPEYNRSIPAVLKNALDVGSRPYGQNVWTAKPCAIISNSPGSLGGFGANHHLRQVLSFLNMYTLQQPEVYLSHIANEIDDNGELHDERVRSFINDFLKSFEKWVIKVS